MKNILRKELTLSASILSYLFTVFGLMFFIPGYPILCGVFFTTLGIFQSFQYAREANDILFSALLPIAKKDVVKSKFLFSCLIEFCSLFLMAFAAILRMTLLKEASVYQSNVMMNANLFALGAAMLMFGLFNLIFVGGFFKTAYQLGKPFLTHIVVAFLIIGIAESLHHIPGLEAVNAFGFEHFHYQLGSLFFGILAYVVITVFSYRHACRSFEGIDL